MPLVTHYAILKRLPSRLVYRNAIVLLELVRDVSHPLPVWVFRARRPSPSSAGRPTTDPATVRQLVAAGRPLPTISPAALAAATVQRPSEVHIDIASSLYGKRDVERQLRRGLKVEADSPAGRIFEALVRLGYAARGRTERG